MDVNSFFHSSLYYIVEVLKRSTYKVTVEAVAELKHARSVGQRLRDEKRLATCKDRVQRCSVQHLKLSASTFSP